MVTEDYKGPFPVPADKFTPKEAPYLYTKFAEAEARRLNLEPRTAGTIAFLGFRPLDRGPVARAWLERGYVVERPAEPAAPELPVWTQAALF